MQLFPALPEVVRGMFRRPEALAVCPPGGGPRERGMFLNQTANYGLSQWEATDRILMEDFNSDNSKIDAALKENADNIAALETAVAEKGNCQIWTTSYVGSGGVGENSRNSLTFPKPPLLVIITGGLENSWGDIAQKTAIFTRDGHVFVPMVSSSLTWPAAWSADGKSVTWYAVNSDAAGQLNAAGTTYRVTAFLTAE